MKVKLRYTTLTTSRYYSPRYKKWVITKAGFNSDGATGAFDVSGPVKVFDNWHQTAKSVSLGWLQHDKLKKTKVFADGSICSNFQASTILSDILRTEKRWFRARSWWVATFLWGELTKII